MHSACVPPSELATFRLARFRLRLNSREYRHFVGIARGSAAEVSYQLLLAKDLGYISPEHYAELRSSRPCRKRSAYSGLPSFSLHSSYEYEADPIPTIEKFRRNV